MAQGIILAAGSARRAKANKLLWLYQGKTLIDHALETMLDYVEEVFIVTGQYHDELVQHLQDIDRVHVIYNADHRLGMFSSVKKGVAKVTQDFFILPGDCPFVKGETYKRLLNGSNHVRVPIYNTYKGHPLFLSLALKERLLEAPDTSNLKAFRNQFELECIPSDDEGVLVDIDTFEDFQAIQNWVRKD